LICAVQDFLNGVTSHTIWLTKGKLTYYTGNYDTFVKTVKENEVIQTKKYEKEQEDRKHIKVCGSGVSLSASEVLPNSPPSLAHLAH